jgi:ribA/ribD-fused uncharacterized protein
MFSTWNTRSYGYQYNTYYTYSRSLYTSTFGTPNYYYTLPSVVYPTLYLAQGLDSDADINELTGKAPEHAVLPDTIEFFDPTVPYGELTNFHYAPYHLDGRIWATCEHYFQANKFVDSPDIYDQIWSAEMPSDVFDIVHKNESHARKNWHSEKEKVLMKALLAKFTQNEYLRKLLIGTGKSKLVQHNASDSYWADGGDGTGQNKLGECLMKIRTEVEDYTKYPAATSPPPECVLKCQYCQKKPPSAGSPCCSGQCAQNLKGNVPKSETSQASAAGPSMCINCHQRPPNPPHQFCGKTCASQHAASTKATR